MEIGTSWENDEGIKICGKSDDNAIKISCIGDSKYVKNSSCEGVYFILMLF